MHAHTVQLLKEKMGGRLLLKALVPGFQVSGSGGPRWGVGGPGWRGGGFVKRGPRVGRGGGWGGVRHRSTALGRGAEGGRWCWLCFGCKRRVGWGEFRQSYRL